MTATKLKKSCDACRYSKVKCSGGTPCERCKQRSLDCCYSPRKKRVHRKRSAEEEALETGETQVENLMQDWERRSWSVFFTLYKNYNSECCGFWFEQQLNKMQVYLKNEGNNKIYKQLKECMKNLNVDSKAVAKKSIDFLRRMRAYNALNAKLPAETNQPFSCDELRMQGVEGSVPFLRVKTGFRFRNDVREEDDIFVACNQLFASTFGLSAQQVVDELKRTYGGFLPWGGDVLARLLTNETDLLAYIQVMAIKFNTLGPPKSLPQQRSIPSIHVFDLQTVHGPTKCMVKCAHVQQFTTDSIHLNLCLEISPLVPGSTGFSPMENIGANPMSSVDRACGSPFPSGKYSEFADQQNYFDHKRKRARTDDFGTSKTFPSEPQSQRLNHETEPDNGWAAYPLLDVDLLTESLFPTFEGKDTRISNENSNNNQNHIPLASPVGSCFVDLNL